MTLYFISFDPEIRMKENLPISVSLADSHLRRMIKEATGVLLPGYVSPWRYNGIARHTPDWLLQLQARFLYHGKTDQILLFRQLGIRHPESIFTEA